MWPHRHEVPPAYLHRPSEQEEAARVLANHHLGLMAKAIQRERWRRRIRASLGWLVLVVIAVVTVTLLV